MKKVLGLDLGTNSIGWALTTQDFENKKGKIDGLGSRIIPMSQDILGKFDSGQSHSQTANRTSYRGVRRLYQRNLLRRERLHRVLNILDFLPKHYKEAIDFDKHFGQFKKNTKVKLNYCKNEDGKHEFIFMDSFNEMVVEFKEKNPDLFYLKKDGKETKIPLDWTIYYLRKKALTEKITKEELAWVLLNFNQKRGYYQLRGEDEDESKTSKKEFYSLKVNKVVATEDKNARGIWYHVILENNWVYKRQSKEPLDNWVGKTKAFIVTTQLEKDGTDKLDKEGNIRRSFSAVDSEKDWIAIKKKTEQDIEQSTKTVGQYIYETLLNNPSQKIRGKLVKTIERKFYKEELQAILKTQIKFHPELKNRELYRACVNELYPRNEAHQNNIKDKPNDKMFDYLFIDDIIFYQRPLKSKKSTISNCPYENRVFTINNVKQKPQFLKCISKSHPLFQEFRLWQFLKNLKIHQKENTENRKIDEDITDSIFTCDNDWVLLFDFLNDKKEVEQKHIIQFLIEQKKIEKSEKGNYRWNYVEDKKYPANETRASFLSRLEKVKNVNENDFLSKEKEIALWHIIYSVKDKKEYEAALKTFALKNNLDKDSFVAAFIKHSPFKNDYGAYSEKAIKKILPLMRIGKYWDESKISDKVKNRISQIQERLESINYDNITSESTAINCAYVTGIIQEFVGDEQLQPTVSGRMSSLNFNFNIKTIRDDINIEVNNSQIEIDGGYEGAEFLSLIEAKNSISSDFLVRQLFYPYKLWTDKVTKKVKTIFLTYSNGVFHFREYLFEDPNLYNSLVLVKEKKYVIYDNVINLELIQRITDNTELAKELNVPFPQADSFERVINLCELLNENGMLSREYITINYDFDVRQTNYYTDACRYLGLIDKTRKNGEINYYLTAEGNRIFSSNITERQIEFIKLILSHRVFKEVIKAYFLHLEPLNKEKIVEIMKNSELYKVNSESTFKRRASTISSWVEWILDQVEE